jgi:N-acetylglutamate synthase-like GNAT family acetyltransferase
MQIRVANRQDEPAIRAIVNEAMAQAGKPEIDTAAKDADLNNVDAQYFWYDGIFLVAEDEGTIVGLLGARRGDSEETLELLRLAVGADWRKKGIARLLLDQLFFFAHNANYKRVTMQPARQHLDETRPLTPFTQEAAGRWVAPVDVAFKQGCCN